MDEYLTPILEQIHQYKKNDTLSKKDKQKLETNLIKISHKVREFDEKCHCGHHDLDVMYELYFKNLDISEAERKINYLGKQLIPTIERHVKCCIKGDRMYNELLTVFKKKVTNNNNILKNYKYIAMSDIKEEDSIVIIDKFDDSKIKPVNMDHINIGHLKMESYA